MFNRPSCESMRFELYSEYLFYFLTEQVDENENEKMLQLLESWLSNTA